MGTLWHAYGMALPAPSTGMLYAAQLNWERHEAQHEAAWLAGLAALLVGAVGTTWLRRRLRRELQPLEHLSQAVAHCDPLDPSHGLRQADRAELLPMEQAINQLSQRVALRLASERAFSAHAAQALRTPLAGIDAQLGVALRESPPELAGRLQLVRGAAQRLPVAGVAVRSKGLDTLDADPDLLTAALANLLDNAAHCGAPTVTVQASTWADGVQLEVHDNGLGLEAGLRGRLQAELAARRYGALLGLGLMLADLVARAHGGQGDLPDPEPAEPNPGCTVRLRLCRPGGP